MDEIGLAMLFGMQFGSRQNDSQFEGEKNRIRQQILDAKIKEISEVAQKNAAKLCVAALVGELRKKAAGIPFTPRHSVPNNHKARVEDFVDTAVAELNRMSSGKLYFSAGSQAAIKGSGCCDVLDAVKGFVTLKVQRRP